MAENAVQGSCPEAGVHTNRKACPFSLKNWREGPFKSLGAAVLISVDAALLASSFIFTERESFLTL